jgi:heat shock protein HtpX
MMISRSREYEADAGAALITRSPHSLANALAKLENVNTYAGHQYANATTAHLFIVKPGALGMLATLFSTHPPIHERIKRLNRMENQAS